jgi:PEP-CTERM motif-containing protein
MVRRVALAALLIAVLAAPASSAPVSLGFLQYDVFIPDDPEVLGTVTFTIGNLTAVGFSGYPVVDELVFQNARLELTVDGAAPETHDLGALGVGEFVFSPPEFPVVTAFTSVRLLASLSATDFLIDDGLGGSTLFTASSDQIVATLFFGGQPLLPGDVVDIQVMPAAATVPEPSSLLLVAIGAALTLRARRRRRIGR